MRLYRHTCIPIKCFIIIIIITATTTLPAPMVSDKAQLGQLSLLRENSVPCLFTCVEVCFLLTVQRTNNFSKTWLCREETRTSHSVFHLWSGFSEFLSNYSSRLRSILQFLFA